MPVKKAGYSSTAKNTMERLLQKPIEWVISIKLERNFTKEEIIKELLKAEKILSQKKRKET